MTAPHLRDLLAESDGEPLDENAAIPNGHMPSEHGRTMSVTEAWRQHLCTKEAKINGCMQSVTKPIAANVTTILRHHPSWSGVVAYDEFRESIVTLREPPWDPEDAPLTVRLGEWSDSDTSRLVAWLARHERIDVPDRAAESGLQVAAGAHVIHPVRDYLTDLVWDESPRLDGMLCRYFGTPDTLYERGVGSRWMISCVARIMVPGCQVDCTLILEGPSGRGKTSAFRSLVPVQSWYADSGIDIGDKDSYGALRAVWLYGLDELDSLRKGEITRVKNFLTATFDHYREPYAKRARDFLRQNVFCGTTNEAQYLVDRTGNRRFLPVRVTHVDLEALRYDRDQLWAEAVARYRAGEAWHVDTLGFRVLCEEQQAERLLAEDPWTGLVHEWLASPTCAASGGDWREPLDVSGGITTLSVLLHCLHVRRADVEVRQNMRVGAILRELGYQRERREKDGVRSYVYLPGDAAG